MIRHQFIRVLIHLLLAAFLSNAANKFFVADVEADASRYDLIFRSLGEAPDQYRILPLLGLKALCHWMPFHTAVLVFNFVLGFVCLELFMPLLGAWKWRTKMAFSVLFSAAYIYTLYTGWRPDTLGLLAICQLVTLLALRVPQGVVWVVAMTLGLIALAFSRAEMALVYAFVIALHFGRRWVLAFAWMGLAVAVQLTLSKLIFPDAHYTTQTVMLSDNLSGYYLVRNPSTWLILAACLIWWKPLSTYVRNTWRKFFYFYLAALGYVVLVLVIGRINEYRLYLPFLPLLLMLLMHATHQNEQKTSAV
jgi:hypothetical protein